LNFNKIEHFAKVSRFYAVFDACHLMLGTSGERIETIHRHILDMVKPIAMLNKQRAGT